MHSNYMYVYSKSVSVYNIDQAENYIHKPAVF